MRCTLNKPHSCFNCPYPDCIDESARTSWDEKEFLRVCHVEYEAHRRERAGYFKTYIDTHEDVKKANRERALRYYREHKDEINERKRRQRKAAKYGRVYEVAQ